MAQTTFHDTTVNTGGDLPAVGSAAPGFTLTGGDLSPVTLEALSGRNVVLNIFPSIDTGVCATSVRTFNQRAAGLDNTTVICASMDLPFAGSRFCGAEGIENVTIGSIFRNREFLDDYGVEMVDGPLRGLTARAVVVVAPDGTVTHTELVEAITSEPDYDAALAACS
ncbi:thiol peroxidase [Candidatus Poriferisocius sp.]|uniref:thiol peroxidase n=1 Tax=Candidatus Poriferisocius sp. TaxID=3101276 RepID=UPI003B02667C